MKTINLLSLFLLLIALSDCSKSKDTVTPVPPMATVIIASYPLLSDNVDVTGKNVGMKLQNAPFRNGGIYCNGKYEYGADSACIARTPSIVKFNNNSFAVTVDFQVSAFVDQPVFVIGSGCRWLGFYLQGGGSVALLYNNANYIQGAQPYSLNEWHNAKISYDGTTARMFLDDVYACSIKFGGGYVPLDNISCGPLDNEIGVTNYSNGQVFEGYIKNLKVYGP